MSEWWSYRLSDFLMFSPRTYWRLVELYNRELWPAQLLALGAGAAALWLARRGGPAGRMLAALLAMAWLWVGWAFHWQRYASIHLAAPWLAALCLLQALLLLGLAVLPPANEGAAATRRFGWLLAAAAVLLYPFAGLAFGRPLAQAEVFGMAADPTAWATLGLLLAGPWPLRPAPLALLCVVPVLSLAIGLATLSAMAGQ